MSALDISNLAFVAPSIRNTRNLSQFLPYVTAGSISMSASDGGPGRIASQGSKFSVSIFTSISFAELSTSSGTVSRKRSPRSLL